MGGDVDGDGDVALAPPRSGFEHTGTQRRVSVALKTEQVYAIAGQCEARGALPTRYRHLESLVAQALLTPR